MTAGLKVRCWPKETNRSRPIADIGTLWDMGPMFNFDRWADWLHVEAGKFEPERYRLIEHFDSRPLRETSGNPSFGLKLDTHERVGQIGFWLNGLCDFAVVDVPTDTYLVNEAGLEANDETVPPLFARFLSFYDVPPI